MIVCTLLLPTVVAALDTCIADKEAHDVTEVYQADARSMSLLQTQQKMGRVADVLPISFNASLSSLNEHMDAWSMPGMSVLQTKLMTERSVVEDEVTAVQEDARAARVAAEAAANRVAAANAAVRRAEEAAQKAKVEKRIADRNLLMDVGKALAKAELTVNAKKVDVAAAPSPKANAASQHNVSDYWNDVSLSIRGWWLRNNDLQQNEIEPLLALSERHLSDVFTVVFGVIFVSWLLLSIATVLVGSELLPRLRLLRLCISLSVSSWGMIVANKYLMMKIRSPGFVLAVQMTLAVVMSIVLAGGRLSFESKQVRGWILVPFISCLQLWTALCAMKHLPLSTLMIIRSFGPLMTLPIEYNVMAEEKRPVVTHGSIFALLVVYMATSYMGAPFSSEGVGLAFLSMVMAVIDVVVRRRLLVMKCSEMPIPMCMLLNNIIGIVPCLFIAFFSGEVLDIDSKAVFSTHVLAVLLVSGIIGSGISYFALNLQKEMAATTFMVLENGIQLSEILAGVVLLRNPFSWPSRMLGPFIGCCGSLWYAMAQKCGSEPSSKPIR